MANQKLPGFTTTIRDGGLVLATMEPVTERLLIIGNALDGPVNTPFRVRTVSEAEEIFGPLTYTKGYKDPVSDTENGKWADNNLVNGLVEALYGGAGNIVLVRSGGTLATYTPTGVSLRMTPVAPGRIYNGITVTIAQGSGNTTVTIAQPAAKGGSISVSVPSATTTLQELCDILNTDSRNRTILFSTVPVSGGLLTNVLTSTTFTFSGGTNGTGAPNEDNYLSKTAYYTALTAADTGTFATLVDQEFNICLLQGIYADDQVGPTATTSVATDFATFLHNVTRETMPCHGVIGLRPTGLQTPSALAAYASAALLSTTAGFYNAGARWIKFGYFMNNGFSTIDDESGKTIDTGRYLSVIAGPDVVLSSKDRGSYYTNGAAIYAGMITHLGAQYATTNKALPGVSSLLSNFPKAICEQLVQGLGYDTSTNSKGMGAYVVFRTNPLRGVPIVLQDNTAAQRTSDFKVLQVERIVNLAIQMVKSVLFPYIGEPSTVEALMSMKVALTTELTRLSEVGALQGGPGEGFDFTISADPVDNVFNQVNVMLRLRPTLQIKYVVVDVSVSH